MKRLFVILMTAILLLSLCACQKTCKFEKCENTPLEGSEYCEKHICKYPGCNEYGSLYYGDIRYCEGHWYQVYNEERDAENPYAVLELECGMVVEGVAYWTLKNNGICDYKNIDIQITSTGKYGLSQTVTEHCRELKAGASDDNYHVIIFCQEGGTITARIVGYEKD